MDAYGVVFRDVLQPTWERAIRGRPTVSHLRFLTQSQWLSPEELRQIQLESLRALLRHASANVPYYGKLLAKTGLAADDVRCLDDLRKIPLLTRERARQTLTERKSVRPPLPEVRKMTSGTSGSPLEFVYDVGSEHWRNAVRQRGYAWAHFLPGDKVVHYWGRIGSLHHVPLTRRAWMGLDHWLRRETYIDCTDRSHAALDHVASVLDHTRPRALVCYAQAGAALARHLLRTGRAVPAGMSVLSAAERLFPADREVMIQAFGPRVFETYGSREVMLIASECDAHHGLHVSMENLIVELLVRDGTELRPAEPGESGEVVVTDLHNFGAPFVRYVTGDSATLLSRERCECGRGLERLAAVDGRTNDTLRDGEGKPVSGLMFNVLFSVMADRVREFQVIQRRDGSVDLAVVPALGFDGQVLELIRKGSAKFLPGIEVRIGVVAEIPAEPGGKRRVVKVET